MFAFGAGIAASVCVGKAAGEGDHHKAKQYAKLIVLMTFVMIMILAVFVLQARNLIALIFTREKNIVANVTEAFKILGATLIFHGLGLV
jgi:Na+-driven multidrug efflux pump